MRNPRRVRGAMGPASIGLLLFACTGEVITSHRASGGGGQDGTGGAGSAVSASVSTTSSQSSTASGSGTSGIGGGTSASGTGSGGLGGCSPQGSCASGLTCCDAECYDLATDPAHCGSCQFACALLPHAGTLCSLGGCVMGSCEPGFDDCNGETLDGCEQDLASDGPCTCAPESIESCYAGPPGTVGVGPCLAGTRTCNAGGTGWGPCVGAVLPAAEGCPNQIDDDCNGFLDDSGITDSDGDGWTACDGDCREYADPTCPVPALVNPGAMEVVGNALDDDCDPSTSDAQEAPSCSTDESTSGLTGIALAAAMDLCQLATPSPPLPAKKWGLLTADLLLPDGSPASAAELAVLQDFQTAVLTGFGDTVVPKKGATLAALSTGILRTPAMAGHVPPMPGTDFGRSGQPPAVFSSAHGGALPASGGCNGPCPSGSGAYDGVALRLSIRVPTNAAAFSFAFQFLSAEYANLCSPSNDYFLALLQSAALGLPPDGNVAFDGIGNWVSVNNLLFDSCAAAGCSSCPDGTAPLAGTGFEAGGATKWLQSDAPVVGGETLTLDLALFDVSSGLGDSLVLLDHLRFFLPCPPGGCITPHP